MEERDGTLAREGCAGLPSWVEGLISGKGLASPAEGMGGSPSDSRVHGDTEALGPAKGGDSGLSSHILPPLVPGDPLRNLQQLLAWLSGPAGFEKAFLALPNATLQQYLERRKATQLPFASREVDEYLLRRLLREGGEVLVVEGDDEAPAFFFGSRTLAFPVPHRWGAVGCERVDCIFSGRAGRSARYLFCWEAPYYAGECCFKKGRVRERVPADCMGCPLLPFSVVLLLSRKTWGEEDVLAFQLASERCSLIMDDLFFRDYSERRQKLDSALSKIAAKMGEITDFQKAMNLLLSTAMALLAADRGSIYIYEEQSGELRFAAWHNLPENVDVSTPRKAESGIAAWVARHGKPLVLQDRVEGESFQGIDPRVKSSISFPLFHRGDVFGVLNLGITDGGRRFCEADLHVLESLTAIGAMGMENAMLHRSMEEKEHLHRKLLAKIINAQEDERKRIASDIHDDTIQSLISCFYQLEAAEMMMEEGSTGKALELLRGIKRDLQRNITCMRRLLFDLRPSILDDAGLVPAIEDYLNRLEEEMGIRSFLYVAEDVGEVEPDLGVSVYRMAQEVFANIRKHSAATEVEVKLYRQGRFLVMNVRDNGVGFDPDRLMEERGAEEHFGLRSLRERVELAGGEMEIRSRPGEGTEVLIRVPSIS
jgi:signal transduction histidine kinase